MSRDSPDLPGIFLTDQLRLFNVVDQYNYTYNIYVFIHSVVSRQNNVPLAAVMLLVRICVGLSLS